jgi:hypothetical protein
LRAEWNPKNDEFWGRVKRFGVSNYFDFIRLGRTPLDHKSIPSLGLWIVVFGLLFPTISNAAFGFKLDGSLDKEAISHAYFEGEFNRVLPPLEMYRQNFPTTATREDSVFAFKYLSVIYAANPSTRAKAESYMVQLVMLMPTIELIDLYISDNIQAIFKDIKQHYLQQQKYVREHDLVGNVKPDTIAVLRPKVHSKTWIWLAVGVVGAAAVATTAFVLLHEDTGPPKPSEPIRP